MKFHFFIILSDSSDSYCFNLEDNQNFQVNLKISHSPPSGRYIVLSGRVMLDCGFSPLMSSLSDRNMILGDVLLPPGGKQRCLYLWVQGLFTLCNVLLMQLSIALDVHFGWDSQLNTSEMFWIENHSWAIDRIKNALQC